MTSISISEVDGQSYASWGDPDILNYPSDSDLALLKKFESSSKFKKVCDWVRKHE